MKLFNLNFKSFDGAKLWVWDCLKIFSQLFGFQRPSVAGNRHFDTSATPSQAQKLSLRHVTSTIGHFDTWLRPSVTSIRHFDNPSLRQKKPQELTDFCRFDELSKWRVKVTNDRSHVSLSLMVEVTCRIEGFWDLSGSGLCVESWVLLRRWNIAKFLFQL